MIKDHPAGALGYMVPSPNRANDRDQKGRFAKGNPSGPGNPHVRRVGELRIAILEAVTPDRIVKVLEVLYQKALKGDVLAARGLLDRALGKPKMTLEQTQNLPSAKELRTHLTALVQANPELPDRLAAMGRKQVAATVLPAAPESRAKASGGHRRDDNLPRKAT